MKLSNIVLTNSAFKTLVDLYRARPWLWNPSDSKYHLKGGVARGRQFTELVEVFAHPEVPNSATMIKLIRAMHSKYKDHVCRGKDSELTRSLDDFLRSLTIEALVDKKVVEQIQKERTRQGLKQLRFDIGRRTNAQMDSMDSEPSEKVNLVIKQREEEQKAELSSANKVELPLEPHELVEVILNDTLKPWPGSQYSTDVADNARVDVSNFDSISNTPTATFLKFVGAELILMPSSIQRSFEASVIELMAQCYHKVLVTTNTSAV